MWRSEVSSAVVFYLSVIVSLASQQEQEVTFSTLKQPLKNNIIKLNNYKHNSVQNKLQIIRQRQYPKDHIRFFLYPDQKNTAHSEELIVGNTNSLDSYNSAYYPIIIIHGFMQNYTNTHPQLIKDAYLRQGFPSNIIMVDWQQLSQPKRGYIYNLAVGYPDASNHVGRIAHQLTDLILFLIRERKLADPTSVHIIGFSLGGQIAGVTGYKVRKATGKKIGRITALDPAGLQFQLYSAYQKKLDVSDADFVDVYHTSALGYGSSIGHVDFYPNGGGPTQPGCISPVDFQRDIPGLPGSCPHVRAWDYFTTSIYNGDQYACRAPSYFAYKLRQTCAEPLTFGQYVPSSARGDYYLRIEH